VNALRAEVPSYELRATCPAGAACPHCGTKLRASCDMWGAYLVCETCGFACDPEAAMASAREQSLSADIVSFAAGVEAAGDWAADC